MDDTAKLLERKLLHLIRHACRMRSLLARLTDDERVPQLYRRHAAQCVLALEASADWMIVGLGDAPPVWRDAPADDEFRVPSSKLQVRNLHPATCNGQPPRRMRSDVAQRLAAIRTFLIAGGPASVKEIGAATGIPWQRVRALLPRLPIIKHGTWPARYALAETPAA